MADTSAAAKKAARTKKPRAAADKAAKTRKQRAAPHKAAATRKLNAVQHAGEERRQYIEGQFCSKFRDWAQACMTSLDTDSEETKRWREEFQKHWVFMEIAIQKSNLLARLLYAGETVRKRTLSDP